jgi:hypothetical protein
MMIESKKVVRVTKKEFELEGGRVFEHPVELESSPTVEEFQRIYDSWVETFQKIRGIAKKF